MLVIGVTGSFGTGKTTVCEILAQLGATVMNADTRACLQKEFREDILKLQDLLGRDLSIWLRDDLSKTTPYRKFWEVSAPRRGEPKRHYVPS